MELGCKWLWHKYRVPGKWVPKNGKHMGWWSWAEQLYTCWSYTWHNPATFVSTFLGNKFAWWVMVHTYQFRKLERAFPFQRIGSKEYVESWRLWVIQNLQRGILENLSHWHWEWFAKSTQHLNIDTLLFKPLVSIWRKCSAENMEKYCKASNEGIALFRRMQFIS